LATLSRASRGTSQNKDPYGEKGHMEKSAVIPVPVTPFPSLHPALGTAVPARGWRAACHRGGVFLGLLPGNPAKFSYLQVYRFR